MCWIVLSHAAERSWGRTGPGKAKSKTPAAGAGSNWWKETASHTCCEAGKKQYPELGREMLTAEHENGFHTSAYWGPRASWNQKPPSSSRKSPIKFLSQDVRDLFSMYIPTIRCLLPEFIWVTNDQSSSWVQVPFQRPSQPKWAKNRLPRKEGSYGLTVLPKKMYWCSNSWNLCKWPYMEIGSL